MFRLQHPKISVHHDQSQPRSVKGASREPIEDLQELELVVKVPFKPQHDFPEFGEGSNLPIALLEDLENRAFLVPAEGKGGDETRPHWAQIVERKPFGHRAFVENVVPEEDFSLQA